MFTDCISCGGITLRNQIISAPGISLLILITYLLDCRKHYKSYEERNP